MSLSFVVGTLFFGGLHLTIFVMYTSSRVIPAFSSAIDNFFPAIPMNGSPFISSFFPGASPTKITSDLKFPLPGTELFLVLLSSHFVHCVTCFLIFFNSCSMLIYTFYCCSSSDCWSSITHNH